VQRVETGETISCAHHPRVGIFVDIAYVNGPKEVREILARIEDDGAEEVIQEMVINFRGVSYAWSMPWHDDNDTVYVGRDGTTILSYSAAHVALQMAVDPRDVLATYVASLTP